MRGAQKHSQRWDRGEERWQRDPDSKVKDSLKKRNTRPNENGRNMKRESRSERRLD